MLTSRVVEGAVTGKVYLRTPTWPVSLCQEYDHTREQMPLLAGRYHTVVVVVVEL